MTPKHIILTALLFLIAGLSLAAPVSAADGSPNLPTQFFGTAATTDGSPLPAGTVITASVGTAASSYTIKEAGKIGSPGTFGEKFLLATSAGGTAEFKIGAVSAEQTYPCTPGGVVEVALTFPLQTQTVTVSSGVSGAPTEAAVISENPVPAGFSLTITEAADKAALPPAPSGTTAVRLLEITPQNAPSGNYQVILTFTLTAAELQSLGVGKESVRFYHHANGGWELLEITDITENAGGSVTYRVKTGGFSAYMIAAAGAVAAATATDTPAVPGGGPAGGQQTQAPSVQPPATASIAPTATASSAPAGTAAPLATLSGGQPAASASAPAKTPAPLFGAVAGAVAAGLAMRRK